MILIALLFASMVALIGAVVNDRPWWWIMGVGFLAGAILTEAMRCA